VPKKIKRGLSGTMIGAAATAIAVKGALSGALGAAAQEPLDQLEHDLRDQGTAALSASGTVVARAASQLVVAPGKQPRQSVAVASALPPSKPLPVDAGQSLVKLDAARRMDRIYSRPLIKRILRDAARRHGVDPKLVLAISYWESGWDQSRVSETGAVGLMQVEPYVADGAGPALLGRPVDITDPYDNADLGVAIFKEDLDRFGDPGTALAAYNQGPDSLKQNGIFPETQAYVQGIIALAATIDS
jgi:soluble lytic murein transglycosylase-like protein